MRAARRRVLVSEEAYLDFSTTFFPGARVLPAISGRARKQLLASASAPALPQIPREAAPAPAGPPARLTRKFTTGNLSSA